MPVPNTDDRLTRRPLRDVVAERLQTAILDGSFQPGEVLTDAELSEWLGVSRTPIREALQRLERVGLIETLPNRYTRVALPEFADAFAAFQALGALFGGVVRVTVPQMSVEYRREALYRIDAEVARLEGGGSPRLVFTADGGYEAWLRFCPNEALVSVVRDVTCGLSFRLRSPDLETKVLSRDHTLRHLPIFRAAVENGDGSRAEEAIERMHFLHESARQCGARR